MAWSQLSRGKGEVCRTCSCVHRSSVEGFHLSSGSRLPGVHWNIYSAAPKVPRHKRPQAGKGAERAGGGGRARELLALASEKGQGVGKRRILRLAAGGGRETSLPPLHHPEMFRDERSETSAMGGSRLTTLQPAHNGTGGGVSGRDALQVCLPVLSSGLDTYRNIYIYLFILEYF